MPHTSHASELASIESELLTRRAAAVRKTLTAAQLRDLKDLVNMEREHPTWALPAPARTAKPLVIAGCLARPKADFSRSNVLITDLGRAVAEKTQ